MTTEPSDDVFGAFDILLEEIEGEVSHTNRQGAQAFEQGDYDGARHALERVDSLTAFRAKVVDLRQEWEALVASSPTASGDEFHRRNLGRLPKGRKTPETAYYQPILQALVDLGGSAGLQDVLQRVEVMVKSVLKPVDWEPMPSDPDQVRWRNTAQWARYSLVQQGLMRDDSPCGIWAISEQGRQWLREH